MTNEEKARELALKEYPVHITYDTNGGEYDFNESDRNTFIEGALEMADWKDQQYKKEFNVPDYCETFEDIVYYIKNDIYECGYNKAKSYYKKQFKEYFEKKRELYHKIASDNRLSKEIWEAKENTIIRIIDELFKED